LKRFKIVSLIIIVVFAAVLLVSCGGDKASTSSDTGGSVSEATAPALNIDAKATDDSVVGNWVDVTDATRFANVVKAADGSITWEDNEGKYKSTFKDGALTIAVNDTETATAYFDAKASQLICVYGGQETKFKKK
jgi:hypothetical protein